MIFLTVIAALELAVIGGLVAVLRLEREAQAKVLAEFSKDAAQERADLISRIQRPEMVPPSPMDRERALLRQETDARMRRELAQVGQVTHLKPEE